MARLALDRIDRHGLGEVLGVTHLAEDCWEFLVPGLEPPPGDSDCKQVPVVAFGYHPGVVDLVYGPSGEDVWVDDNFILDEEAPGATRGSEKCGLPLPPDLAARARQVAR